MGGYLFSIWRTKLWRLKYTFKCLADVPTPFVTSDVIQHRWVGHGQHFATIFNLRTMKTQLCIIHIRPLTTDLIVSLKFKTHWLYTMYQHRLDLYSKSFFLIQLQNVIIRSCSKLNTKLFISIPNNHLNFHVKEGTQLQIRPCAAGV